MLEFIHCFVEVLDKHFGQVCELDIMADPDVVGAGGVSGLALAGSRPPCGSARPALAAPRRARRRAPTPTVAAPEPPRRPHHRRAPTAPSHPHCHAPPHCQVHYILDEMLLNGCVVDTNKANILEPVQLLEQVQ
jgi:hypothetical protein